MRSRVLKVLSLLSLALVAACAGVEPLPAAKPTAQSSELLIPEEIHFSRPDGTALVLPSGLYAVREVREGVLRLHNLGDGGSFELRAETASHDSEVEAPTALLVEEQGLDHIVLALPSGRILDVAGARLGVQPRGARDRRLRPARLRRSMAEARSRALVVKQPNGRAAWRAGQTHEIEWARSGRQQSTVRIVLLRNGRIASTITPSAPNNGRFVWKVPADLGAGRYSLMVVTGDQTLRHQSEPFHLAGARVAADPVRRLPERPSVMPSHSAQIETKPRAPSELDIIDQGSLAAGAPHSYVALMWHDNSAVESGYAIERWSGDTEDFVEIGRVGRDVSYFEDDGVDPGSGSHWWRVRAFNPFGVSEYSRWVGIQDDHNLNPVGGTETLEIPESPEERCRAEGGQWIGLIEYCSRLYQQVYGAAVTVLHPLVQIYKAYFAIVSGGAEMYSLPSDVREAFRPFFGATLLSRLRYGASHHTSSDDTAMTNCTDIYFPAGAGVVADLKNGRILNRTAEGALLYRDHVRWLLHEITHVEQCIDWGGRENYAIRWFGELGTTSMEELISDPRGVSNQAIHDAMPMEDEAEANAQRILGFF